MTTICTFGRIFIPFLLIVLAGCVAEPGKNGAGSSSSSSSNSSSSSSFGSACVKGNHPVCSVATTDDRCDSNVCPLGIYKTYANECEASASAARLDLELRSQGCGADEGKPFYSGPRVCTLEYDPVCAPAKDFKPCTALPCPAIVYRTHGNPCSVGWGEQYGYTSGECGAKESTPVTYLPAGCPGIEIDAYCSKSRYLENCNGQPCIKYQYHNFSSRCEVDAAMASLVNADECGALNNVYSGPEPSIRLESALPVATHSVTIKRASIKQNVVYVSLNYTACAPRHFDLFIDRDLLAGTSVSTEFVFKTVFPESCNAVFNSDFAYDLLPLRYAYKKQFGSEHGEISLPGLGTYAF